MVTREVIEGLREQIRRIERRPPHRPLFSPSGRPEVDALLPGGGFPRGALSELAGGPASGKTALALSSIATAIRSEGLAAFVDGRSELYPPAAADLGIDLERLLIVRPGAAFAPWAAEVLLASGAFEVVALDLPLQGARAVGGATPEAMLRRLQAAAEKGGTVALWLGTSDGHRVPAAVRLELAVEPGGPRVRCRFARGAVGAPGQGGAIHAA